VLSLTGSTMLFSIASNFNEVPEFHQLVFGLAAVATAVATVVATSPTEGRTIFKKLFIKRLVVGGW